MQPLTEQQLKEYAGRPVWDEYGMCCLIVLDGKSIHDSNGETYSLEWIVTEGFDLYPSNPCPDWRKVEDGLPGDGEEVWMIFTYEDGKRHMQKLIYNPFRILRYHPDGEYTHWLPRTDDTPEPPKGDA